jgi:type IV pilus assembly protein PilX
MTARRLPTSRRAQRGAMLIIALIVLVAMTLAGIAMMRSVDTGTVVAGNIAFKEATLHAADQGLQEAFAWLVSKAGTADLNDDNNTAGAASVGYFSSVPTLDPDWRDDSAWTNARQLNGGIADSGGNVIYYQIHRICRVANCAPNATCGGIVNLCGTTPDSSAVSFEGVDQSQPNYFTRPPATHYRVTARSVGPRRSVAVVQTLMRSQ